MKKTSSPSCLTSTSTMTMTLTNPNQVIEVVVEAWQNQRYKHIGRDWTIGDEPLFSDITGNIEIQCEPNPKDTSSDKPASQDTKSNKDGERVIYKGVIPIAVLPEGWDWSTEWGVDLNQGTYGDRDADGWSYSSSFDTLRKNSVFRCLEAIVERSSVYRRRRWTRSRVCRSMPAKELFVSQKAEAEAVCTRIGELVVITGHNCEELLEYNNIRKIKLSEVTLATDNALLENIICLKGFLGKLNQLKSYLLERSAIEQLYSTQLKKLSDKWITAAKKSDVDSASSLQNLDVETSVSKPLHAPESNNSSKNVSFFDIVCTASSTVSAKLQDFSSLLSTSLYSDVNGIVSELESVLSDCETGEAPVLKKNLIASLLSVEAKYNVCDNILKQSRAFNMAQKQFSSQNLYSKCASETDYSTTEESDLYRCTCPFTDLRKSRFVYLIRDILENVSRTKRESSSNENRSFFRRPSFTLASSSTTNTSIDDLVNLSNSNNFLAESALFCNIPYTGFDSWSALQSYRQNVVESEANFFVYQAFVLQQTKYTGDIMVKVSDLLQQALKLFADQHINIWQEAGELFSSIISDNRLGSRSGSSGPREADFECLDGSHNSSANTTTPAIELALLDDLSFSSPDNNNNNNNNNNDNDNDDNNNDNNDDNDNNNYNNDYNNNESGDSWATSSVLDNFNVSQYVMKATRIKFSLFPNSEGSRRNSLRGSLSGGSLSLKEYEIPKPALSNVVDDSDPHAWQQGVLLVTLDGILHILHASGDLGANSVYDILGSNGAWIAHVPIISCEITKLITEPSLVLFPGVDGDALLIRYNADYISNSIQNDESISDDTNFARNAKFMKCFVKDKMPLAVVVESSDEVKSWIRAILNPFAFSRVAAARKEEEDFGLPASEINSIK